LGRNPNSPVCCPSKLFPYCTVNWTVVVLVAEPDVAFTVTV